MSQVRTPVDPIWRRRAQSLLHLGVPRRDSKQEDSGLVLLTPGIPGNLTGAQDFRLRACCRGLRVTCDGTDQGQSVACEGLMVLHVTGLIKGNL